MGFSNVVCFVLHGLLVTAFPTGDYDGADLGLTGVPVEGIAEFSGTAQASGSCRIVGHSPCSDLVPVSSPIVPPTNIVIESDDAITYDTENGDDMAPMNTEYDEVDSNGKIPEKVILGAIIADAIMKQKGTEVDGTLAELDAFVEAEIGNLGLLIQNAVANRDTSEVDHRVDSTLHEIESKITSELALVDAVIDSELTRTEQLVESVTDNADQVGSLFTEVCLNERNVIDIGNSNTKEKEALIAMELSMVESLVETQLAKTEATVEYELEKVNAFVESELAKVDGIVESELAKVDLFVETEQAKTEALVNSDLLKMESFVDAELAKIKTPMEETVDYSDVPPASLSATIAESSDYLPKLSSLEPEDYMMQSDSNIYISGTIPVSGRTMILGHTGCPPIIPTDEPLPLYVESFPVADVHYDDSYGAEYEEEVYDDVETLPLVNRNMDYPPMIGETSPVITTQEMGPGNAYPGQNMQSSESDPIKPQITVLPRVNIRNVGNDGKVTIIGGNLEFSGTARATGGTSLYAEFPCAPLTATEVGPNGKKYIWLSKPVNNGPPTKPTEKPRPDFPSYTADFPEAIIMDSAKNYQKLMSEDLDVDFGVLGPMPVAGEAFFEGTAPAFGSVSIRGHCA